MIFWIFWFILLNMFLIYPDNYWAVNKLIKLQENFSTIELVSFFIPIFSRECNSVILDIIHGCNWLL
jgi:hypothetical protein